MTETDSLADPHQFFKQLPFVKEYGIRILNVAPGKVTFEMPLEARFSMPSANAPASIFCTIGDVAAVASCFSMVPRG